jgi:hypothetical protein
MTPGKSPPLATFGWLFCFWSDMNPLDPIVEVLVRRLDANDRESFEERAGIFQFEAGRPRELAEPLALLEVCRVNPLALVRAVCMSGLAPGGPVYVLALTDTLAKASLGLLGAHRAVPSDLSMALASLGRAAQLTAFQRPPKKARKTAYLK